MIGKTKPYYKGQPCECKEIGSIPEEGCAYCVWPEPTGLKKINKILNDIELFRLQRRSFNRDYQDRIIHIVARLALIFSMGLVLGALLGVFS